MKILFITGSRGEWGYIRPILRLIDQRDDIEYKLLVTNMHLLPAYGSSYKEIESDGFHIDYKINMALDGYDHYTMTKSLGILLMSLPDILEKEKPDWILLAGDRGEQLTAAIAGAYTYIPVAHIQAGELSGNIDGMTRHAIGKYAHLHFASNEDAKQRLISLGEELFRIHNVGAPQLDELISEDYTTLKDIEDDLQVNLSDSYILVVIHPVTEESALVEKYTIQIINALNEFKYTKIVILPNNDAGSSIVKDAILNNRLGNYHIYKNLKRAHYLGLLRNCDCIVGNSSSGLLEAPTFCIPAVNIGRRQHNRFKGINVIDVEGKSSTIIEAIEKARSSEFKQYLLDECVNPYGDGHSSERILQILSDTKVSEQLLVKNLTY
ncbi:UDP-N-acetyl glucosamine 2-epimerase [Clostridia bacterium]|nr:UDP-N-acetyl glucosamine 2-epimerase [Clostridia bacterium]